MVYDAHKGFNIYTTVDNECFVNKSSTKNNWITTFRPPVRFDSQRELFNGAQSTVNLTLYFAIAIMSVRIAGDITNGWGYNSGVEGWGELCGQAKIVLRVPYQGETRRVYRLTKRRTGPAVICPALLIRQRQSDVTLNSALDTLLFNRSHPYHALTNAQLPDRKAHPLV
jgi:hypothetical protein